LKLKLLLGASHGGFDETAPAAFSPDLLKAGRGVFPDERREIGDP
jgi:hypothetical protein